MEKLSLIHIFQQCLDNIVIFHLPCRKVDEIGYKRTDQSQLLLGVILHIYTDSHRLQNIFHIHAIELFRGLQDVK